MEEAKELAQGYYDWNPVNIMGFVHERMDHQKTRVQGLEGRPRPEAPSDIHYYSTRRPPEFLTRSMDQLGYCDYLKGRSFDPSSFVSAAMARQMADYPHSAFVIDDKKWIIMSVSDFVDTQSMRLFDTIYGFLTEKDGFWYKALTNFGKQIGARTSIPFVP